VSSPSSAEKAVAPRWKVLLVDDESRIREGLRDFIPWVEYGLKVVGEAETAIEAQQKAFRLHPHIVIADVVMPDHNGIWLARQLKQTDERVRIVFLSAYRESDYLLDAIKVGAADYLIKPVRRAELASILKRFAVELAAEYAAERSEQRLLRQLARNRPLLVDQFFADLVFGRVTDPSVIADTAIRLGIAGNGGPNYVVVVDVRSGDVDRLFSAAEVQEPIATDQCLRGYSEIVLITQSREIGIEDRIRCLTATCDQLELQACISVSAPAESLDQIGGHYRQARDAAVRHTPVAMVDVITAAGGDGAEGRVERAPVPRYRRVIQGVVDLIETNFMDEMLSVVTLADAVSLSPNYMATLFKSEVGRTVHQYLLAVRLEKAKQLLRNPRYRMYEVANAVGYGNANYFSKMFKKETGMTAREFRESVL